MTNEEAFKDWLKFISVELTGMDLKIAEAAWQAAISYMQEQNKSTEQSEPVTYLKLYSYESGLDRQEGFEEVSKHTEGAFPVFTAPQRQQPLKRLSQLDVLKILNECAKSPYTNTQSSLGFANAIMDEMERTNK